MSDAKLEIIIEAQNRAEKTLDSIQKQVKNLSNETAKSQKSMGKSFSAVQGAMLNVGVAANSVHNIFETLQNSTRKLENAQDRLENATLRQKGAVQDLASAEKKLLEIEQQHIRDANSLAQAQLNLEKAQQRVKETTAQNGSEWAKGTDQYYDAQQALIDLENAQYDLSDAQKLGKKKAEELSDAQQELKDKQDALTIATNNLERSQRQLDKVISDVKWDRINVAFQAIAAVGNIVIAWNSLSTAIGGVSAALGSGGLLASISGVLAAIPGWGWALLALGAIVLGLITYFKKWGDVLGWIKENILMPYWIFLKEWYKWMQFIFLPMWNLLKEVAFSIGKAFNKLKEELAPVFNYLKDKFMPILERISSLIKTIMDGVGKVYSAATKFRDSSISKNTKKVDDAIIRPNGQVIETNPNDTIYATKNGIGGTSITITGNQIYGTDPDEIADAIMKKLRYKINV